MFQKGKTRTIQQKQPAQKHYSVLCCAGPEKVRCMNAVDLTFRMGPSVHSSPHLTEYYYAGGGGAISQLTQKGKNPIIRCSMEKSYEIFFIAARPEF